MKLAGAKNRDGAIRHIEEICGPAEEWPGRCQEIASACLCEGLVSGKLALGAWTGDVPAEVPVTKIPGGGVLHAWILQEDGTIVDPTRWVFEGLEPYVYVGRSDHYTTSGFLDWRRTA